jgi:hypothetical protein
MAARHLISARAASTGPGSPPPPPPPPPPSPPPPPPGGFIDIAQLVVGGSGGNTINGLPIKYAEFPGLALSALLNGSTVAQIDRGTTDLSGDGRFAVLSCGALAAGTYTVSISTDAEANSPVSFTDVAVTTVVANGDTFTSTAAIAAGLVGWARRGPVVSEGVYVHEIPGNQLRVRFHISKYADGKSRTKVFVENAYSLIGAGYNNALDATSAEQLVYDIDITRGALNQSWTDVIHCPFSRYRAFAPSDLFAWGDAECHANVVPLSWGGTAIAGTASYFCDSGMFQNFTGPFTLQSIARLSSTQPGSPSPGDQYTPAKPFSKTKQWSGSAWFVTGNDIGYDGGNIGPFSCRNTAGGDDVSIGVYPEYAKQALFNFDTSGRYLLEWAAGRRLEVLANLRDSVTKKYYRTDVVAGFTGRNYARLSSLAGSSANQIGGIKVALVLSDCTAAQNSTTLHSDTGGFTAGMVGMPVYFTGTGNGNFPGEKYRIIVSRTDTNNVVLDSAPCTAGAGASGTITVNAPLFQQYWEQAHWGAEFFPAYMLTGELEYLEGQIMQELESWSWSPWGDGDSGNNAHGLYRGGQYRHVGQNYWDQYYDTGSGVPQERTQGWGYRTTVQTCAAMPDDETLTNALFGWDKTMVRARWSNVLTGLKTCYIDGSTGTGLRFTSSPVGARFLAASPSSYPNNNWMQGTIYVSLGIGTDKELNELTADGLAFFDWMADGQIALYTDTTDPAMREYLYGSNGDMPSTRDGAEIYWGHPGSPCVTWKHVYDRLSALTPGGLPASTTANYAKSVWADSDWSGYRHDFMAVAVQRGRSGATTAHAWLTATAQHHFSADYFYNRNHSITVRS